MILIEKITEKTCTFWKAKLFVRMLMMMNKKWHSKGQKNGHSLQIMPRLLH